MKEQTQGGKLLKSEETNVTQQR